MAAVSRVEETVGEASAQDGRDLAAQLDDVYAAQQAGGRPCLDIRAACKRIQLLSAACVSDCHSNRREVLEILREDWVEELV